MNTHSVAARRQRTIAGKEGGHATARRNTPATIRTIRQEAARTRFRNMALAECRTDGERELLLANEGELERRADECAQAEGRRIRAAKARKQRERDVAQATSADSLVADFMLYAEALQRVYQTTPERADLHIHDFMADVVSRLHNAQDQIHTLQTRLAELQRAS